MNAFCTKCREKVRIPLLQGRQTGSCGNNHKTDFPSFPVDNAPVIPGPDRESDTGPPLALLLHDGFQLARVGGKGLDVELLLLWTRTSRAHNVVKQSPSSLTGPRLPAGSSETEIRIPQECQRGAKRVN